MPATTLPTISLPVFEGPLDLLLHLIREHKVDIANIPIVPITDQYIAYLNAMEGSNLTLAGEFFLMAATLIEIKTRMLLPKPPPEARDDEEGDVDPRDELIERLLEYEKFKALVGTLQGYEDARQKLFVRDQASFGDQYSLPVDFGELSAATLLRALHAMLADSHEDEHPVTSVRRQKMSLKMAMRTLLRAVADAGRQGIDFVDAFPQRGARLEIIMTFLAMLELLRHGQITAKQDWPLGPIRLTAVAEGAV